MVDGRTDVLRPRVEHLIGGMVATLAAMPIFALLLMIFVPLVDLIGGRAWPDFGEAGWLGTTVSIMLLSFLAVVAWPISVGVATILFAASAWLLTRHQDQIGPMHDRRWLGAGLFVGLMTGLVMSGETYWKMVKLAPSHSPNILTDVLIAMPTGAIAILICRRFVQRFGVNPRHE